jgi:hypothetical protein
MRTEELRVELQQLADEIESFEPNVLALRRRNRTRSLLRAAAVVGILAALVGAIAWTRPRPRASVASTEKEVALDKLHRADVLVVPADAATQSTLERTKLVERYSRVSAMHLPTGSLINVATQEQRLAAAALLQSSSDGFAIQVSGSAEQARDALHKTMPSNAQVFAIGWRSGIDAEVFMKPDAPLNEVSRVRALLIADTRDISGFTFIDHEAAYNEFKRIFADNPALVESVTPAALPESFRLALTLDAKVADVEARYQQMPGVDVVTSPNPSQEFSDDRTP